jgi:purine-nucleoside phosphorylase
MKVLVGPRIDLEAEPGPAAVCKRLAGEDGKLVCLADLGIKNLYRRLSGAEIEAIRRELQVVRGGGESLVGYVCRGVRTVPGQAGWVVVTDHANLTWRSPLTGPNDEQSGPRFPSLDRVYDPEAAMVLMGGEAAAVGRMGGSDGMIVVRGVVAGVQDDRAISGYESDMIRRHGWPAASSELVAPVIIAAHLGLRVAAVVTTA